MLKYSILIKSNGTFPNIRHIGHTTLATKFKLLGSQWVIWPVSWQPPSLSWDIFPGTHFRLGPLIKTGSLIFFFIISTQLWCSNHDRVVFLKQQSRVLATSFQTPRSFNYVFWLNYMRHIYKEIVWSKFKFNIDIIWNRYTLNI